MPKRQSADTVEVRNTHPGDFQSIIELCGKVYPATPPWSAAQLSAHLEQFPAGQFVAVDRATDAVVGMCASLVILWDDYEFNDHWGDFTDGGFFTNHDPEHGRTLYGAEVMVDPAQQGKGIGKKIYAARRSLCKELGLLRIRAGARLRGYHRYAPAMSPQEYVQKVVTRQIGDPTLSFQIKQGFRVVAVVDGYLREDPESLGYAAVIEWLNHEVARKRDYASRGRMFLPPSLQQRFGRPRQPRPGVDPA